MEFLKNLNENQLQAVTYIDGASLVIAGAGSGKTRVLTYKIAYLLKRGMAPNAILALTFTNKAAREMKERIAQIVGEKTARYLRMGTFHSVFSHILRAECERIDYTKNYSIYDSADSKSLIKAIVKELKLDEKQYKPSTVHGRISSAKNSLITAKMYAADSQILKSDMMARMPRISEIYQIYCNRCKQADAMDFDDLLLNTNLLFRNHPDILQKYQQLFGFVLVDEYQDTNFAQYMIVRKLAEQHEHICVVGDDAQSIYSFRGANIDNILTFKNNYKDVKTFKLEQNYRSTKTIVNAANSLIDKNSEQIKKTIFSEKEDGLPIKLINVFTDLEEGAVVAESIADLHADDDYKYNQIAVLYRTNAQSRVMEEALRKQNIPYRIYGGLSFYQRKEIKDVIAYCRLVCNPNDEEALKRIINYPARGIGDTTVAKVIACAQLHAESAWEIMGDPLKYNLDVNSGTATKLANFRAMIAVFSEQLDTQSAYDLVHSIIKTTGMLSNDMFDLSAENIDRKENVEELLSALHEFCETRQERNETALLTDYLSEISLLTDQDTDKSAENDRVTLMTVHAAKGLEFKAVFIVGMEEDLFPSVFSVESERDLEEERRLFYVAITRAEERCVISYAKSRFRHGKTTFSSPSRFIKDIDPQYLEVANANNYTSQPKRFGDWDDDWSSERNDFRKTPQTPIQQEKIIPIPRKKLKKLQASGSGKKTPTVISHIPVGAFVKHHIFGIGKVLETSIEDGNEKAKIDFSEKGVKSLLLKFAKLEVLK